MAKNLSFTRTMVDKLVVKGLLSEDGNDITYVNEDKEEVTVPVNKFLMNFKGLSVEISIADKQSMDLGDGSTEE